MTEGFCLDSRWRKKTHLCEWVNEASLNRAGKRSAVQYKHQSISKLTLTNETALNVRAFTSCFY